MAHDFAFPRIPGRALGLDRAFTWMAWALGVVAFVLPAGIIGYLLINGLRVISLDFLLQNPAGFPLGTAGGIWPAIQGSFALSALALLIAFPLALLSAIYVVEYAPNSRIRAVIRFLAECLAAIPSILYGVFGYAVLVVGLNLRISLMAGSLTLALLMYPILLVGMQEALRRVDPTLREAALSLGVTRWNYMRRLAMGRAFSGIMAITVLAFGHSFGTTAPIMLTASVFHAYGGVSLKDPVMTLPTHLYYLVTEAIDFQYAFATAFVMIATLLICNFLAMLIKRRLG